MHNMAEDGTLGQYEYYVIDEHLSTVEWEMTGYLDDYYKTIDNNKVPVDDYEVVDKNLPELQLTNVFYGSELSKKGIQLQYSGACNDGGIISAYLYLNDYSEETGSKRYMVEKQFADSGTISFSSEELAELPITDNIGVSLYRSRMTVEEFKGKKFVKLFESRFGTRCVLVD